MSKNGQMSDVTGENGYPNNRYPNNPVEHTNKHVDMGRCPTCNSKTLFRVKVKKGSHIENMTKKDVVEAGGDCPSCAAKLYLVKYPSGKSVIRPVEHPRHRDTKRMFAGNVIAADEPKRVDSVEIEGKIKEYCCDVIVNISGYEDWNGLAIEVIVDNNENLEDKREAYLYSGYHLMCVYPEDVLNYFDFDEIRMRELDNY